MGRPRPSRAAPQAEGLGWVGGLRRKARPGLPLALPFKIQPSVEETLGTQQASRKGWCGGPSLGLRPPPIPSPLGWGSQDQSLCVLSHLPPPQTAGMGTLPSGGAGGTQRLVPGWGGAWAVGAGQEGTGAAVRAPRS